MFWVMRRMTSVVDDNDVEEQYGSPPRQSPLPPQPPSLPPQLLPPPPQPPPPQPLSLPPQPQRGLSAGEGCTLLQALDPFTTHYPFRQTSDYISSPPTYHSTHQSPNQPIKHPPNQPIKHPSNQPIKQPLNRRGCSLQ